MTTPFANRTKIDVELGTDFAPKFDAHGLIPVIAVDHETNEVLMVAFMNSDALQKTIDCGEAVYWSRSRKKFWHKGEESGNTQKIKAILTDCDQDCLILQVEQVGGAACHNGYRSCFYRKLENKDGKLVFTQAERVFDPAEVYGRK